MGLGSAVRGFWNGLWAGDPGLDDRYYSDTDMGDFRAVRAAANRHGINVTDDVAMRFSAVFACVRLISEQLSMLPWHVYQFGGETRQQKFDHPVEKLISFRPNRETDSLTFRQALLSSALLTGNGYAEIEPHARRGYPVALYLLEPDRVEPRRDDEGNLFYQVTNEDGQKLRIKPDQMLHVKGFCFGNSDKGLSVVRYAAESIGLGLAVERFGSQFFGNGTTLAGVLEHPGKVTEEAAKNLRDSWKSIYSGFNNAHRVAVLEQGMKFNKISIPPEEAQFLATREFQITEIARWFGVPPHKIADLTKATFSNIEQQSQEFVNDALMPWARRLEISTQNKLFTDQEIESGFYTKIDFRALLRGDSQARAEYYNKMLDKGVYSINEVRNLEDMNPVDGGDLRMVPLNMVSLDRANSDGGTAPQNNKQDGAQNNAGLYMGRGSASTNGHHKRF